MTRVDPVACAMFLLTAFMVAGAVQTAWFAAHASPVFAATIVPTIGLTIHWMFSLLMFPLGLKQRPA